MTGPIPTSLDLALLLKETALAGLDAEIARLEEDRGRIAEEVMELRMRRAQGVPPAAARGAHS